MRAAKEKRITGPLDDDITNAKLEEILFPGKYKSGCWYVAMALLWKEYCRKRHESGETPYMGIQFGDRWARVTKATMRIQHTPGDTIQVDWAVEAPFQYRNGRNCLLWE